MKKLVAILLAGVLAIGCFTGCGKGNAGEQVIIYSNADDEEWLGKTQCFLGNYSKADEGFVDKNGSSNYYTKCI